MQVTTSNSPTLGIIRDPNKPITFDTLNLAVLVPNGAAGGNLLDFMVDFGSSTTDAHLFSTTAWTSGFLLENYLGMTTWGDPPQPLDAFLGATQAVAGSDNTGYYVYLATFGPVSFPTPDQFGGCGGPCPGTTFDFPNGTVFTAFAGGPADSTHPFGTPVMDTTAQSSAVLIDAPTRQPPPPPPPAAVPEPSSIVLLASAVGAIATAKKKMMS